MFGKRLSPQLKLLFQILPVVFIAGAAIVGASRLDIVQKYLAEASGEPANLTVDVNNDLGPLPRPWQNLSQGGEMADWNLTPIQGKVAALQPKYIRLDHIYTLYDVVSVGADGKATYDFSKLDATVNQITAVGAKPYFSLSYIPAALSADGTITGQPKNWGDWQNLVRATIQHYSADKGISDAMYEVWNEPDLFGGWKPYGDKNYLTLYWYANLGQAQVKNAKPFKFGGPATTDLYPTWVEAMANMVQNQGARLDFLSWHHYGNDMEDYRNNFALGVQLKKKYPVLANVELQITEFGPNSENNPINDNNIGAAHLAAVATEMPGVIDRGFIFEVEDGKDPKGEEYWGRWGLLSNRDFGANPKPRYNALRMLNRLTGDQVQVLGKGTWVKGLAAKNGDTINMVIVNYDQHNQHTENTPLTFKNVLPGNYLLSITPLRGAVQQIPLSTTSTELKTSLPLAVNTVDFVELTPQPNQ